MKVLFAVDGSREAIGALGNGCRFLQTKRMEADVVCVAPEYLAAMTGWEEGKLRERYRQRIAGETHRILNEARDVLRSFGTEAKAIAATGSVGGKIAEMAADYDIVVLGAKGKADVRNRGLGPVAQHVAQHAGCSVLVGRPAEGGNGFRVLVALDGSEASLESVRTVASLVNWENAGVTLLHVLETPWLHLGLEQDWFGYEEPEEPDAAAAWQRRLRAEAERLLERAGRQLGEQRPAVERKLAEGLPANEILGEAEQGGYDLVVVGATGASDLKHQLLGSVSSKLAWHAPCSVLIVRNKETLR